MSAQRDNSMPGGWLLGDQGIDEGANETLDSDSPEVRERDELIRSGGDTLH